MSRVDGLKMGSINGIKNQLVFLRDSKKQLGFINL